jgi:hypothetical protein
MNEQEIITEFKRRHTLKLVSMTMSFLIFVALYSWLLKENFLLFIFVSLTVMIGISTLTNKYIYKCPKCSLTPVVKAIGPSKEYTALFPDKCPKCGVKLK